MLRHFTRLGTLSPFLALSPFVAFFAANSAFAQTADEGQPVPAPRTGAPEEATDQAADEGADTSDGASDQAEVGVETTQAASTLGEGTKETPPAASEPSAQGETTRDAASAEATGTESVSDAEVDRFLEEAQLGGGTFQPSLHLSGFADFNYTHFIAKDNDPWRILYNNKGNFGVGNLNVYFDGRISETVRSFAEVRFTYLPHGSVDSLGPPTTRTNNSSSDYTRNERDVQLGGVRIERAFLQWSPHQLLRVTAGHWLTPYGLWNVDHGTPTIVPATRPFIIDEELLPESQSGILLEGRYDLTDRVALEYGAGISNGRGPIDTYYDFDENKGLTGRLKVLYSGAGELQVGVSGYHGTYTNANIGLTINEDGLSSSDIIRAKFRETSLAADVRYTNGGLLFQSEAILNDRNYEEGGQSQVTGGLTPDMRRWGVYGLLGYRFNWFGVMPYALGEYAPVPNASIPELPRTVLLLGGGLNIRAIAEVVVKVSYTQAAFPSPRENSFEEHPIRRVQGQVAWAF